MEPLYEGQFDPLPQGSTCIANAYTSNHDALQDPKIGAGRAFVLHAIDAVGLVHAAILRLQALLLPVRTLVLGGGHRAGGRWPGPQAPRHRRQPRPRGRLPAGRHRRS